MNVSTVRNDNGSASIKVFNDFNEMVVTLNFTPEQAAATAMKLVGSDFVIIDTRITASE